MCDMLDEAIVMTQVEICGDFFGNTTNWIKIGRLEVKGDEKLYFTNTDITGIGEREGSYGLKIKMVRLCAN